MSNLQIQKLKISSAPGFAYGLDELQFGQGLNIIFGPNASGKTTTARAMKTLIWLDQYKQARGFSLTGSYQALDSDYLINWERGYLDVQKDRRPVDIPGLPIPEHPTLYDLSMTDLLSSDDQDFAGVIWQEVMGGIDINKAVKKLVAGDDLPRKNNSIYREFEDARKALREVEQKQKNLSERKDGLDKLQKELEQAQSAQRKSELIDKLNRIRQLEAQKKEKQTEREQLPEVLDRLTGEEAGQMKKLEDQCRSKQKDIGTQQENIEGYREQLRQLHLPENGVPDHKLSVWQEQLRRLEAVDQKVKETREKIDDASAKLQSIKGEYNWEVDPEQVTFSSDHINKLAEWTRNWYSTEHKIIEINNSIEQYGDVDKPEFTPEQLQRGIDELSKWLKEVPTNQEIGIPPKLVWTALALVIVSAAVAPFSLIAAGVGLVAGVTVLLIGLFRRKNSGIDKAEIYRQEYQKTGLQQPDNWTVDEVSALLDKLSEMRTDSRLKERYLQELEKLQSRKKKLEKDLQSLEDERTSLIKETGIAPNQHAQITLLTMMEAVRAIKERTEQIEAGKNELEELREQRTSIASSLKQEFESYVTESFSEDELKPVFEQIKERKSTFDYLNKSIKEADGALKRLRGELEELESDLQNIKEKTGCDNSEQVNVLLQDFNRNQELRNKIRELDAQIEPALEQLQQYPEFEREWLDLDDATLINRKDQFAEAGKRVDGLRKDITQIEYDIRTYEQGRDLETARAAYDKARLNLAGLRSEYLRQHMKMLVKEFMLEQHKSESYPEVFQAAARNFSRFTHGSFELEISGEDKGFRAKDVETQRGLELNQLSSGTRIQLLLAVRMAFIQKEEQNLQLPLFADELLAVSDSRRADAIVESLHEMVKEGRQVFYFTAQEEEVKRWEDAADKHAGLQDPAIHSLTGSPTPVSVEWNPAPPKTELVKGIPQPQNADYEAYLMQLELPGFNPLTQNPEEIPLWMILNDPEVLYECLAQGITKWGKLESWLRQGLEIPSVSEDQKKELLQIGKLLNQALQLYRRGRPYPVAFSDLEEGGVTFGKNANGVKEMINHVDGHPEKLLENVTSIQGVGNSKKGDIEEFLRDNGYLPSEDMLSDDEFEFEISKLAEQYQLGGRKPLENVLNRVLSGETKSETEH